MNKAVVFSGIAPSGNLHIGNYLGAIQHWVKRQQEKNNIFCVVDLHAITTPQDPRELREKIYEVAALYLACGIDPQHSNVFIQSHNPDHAELAWILDCYTPMGWMKRMTQFKDKSKKQKESVTVGLFNYPVLMAADILLYQTQEVPVGDDQKQHVEITRDIADRFNSRYGEILALPEAIIDTSGARIMSLQDPFNKMSKSDSNVDGAIYLLDDLDTVQRKIKSCVTDSGREIRSGEDKPALTNLLTLFSSFSGQSVSVLEKTYQGASYQDFKKDLAEVVVQFLKPIQDRYTQIRNQKDYLQSVLHQGLERVRPISSKTLQRVKDAVGLG